VKLGRGAVVVVELGPTIGHEQHGARPCVVVSDPDVISDQRFPLVCVVPITGTPGEGLLYPPLAPGQSGLAKSSSRRSTICDRLTNGESGVSSVNLRGKRSLPSMRGWLSSSDLATGFMGRA